MCAELADPLGSEHGEELRSIGCGVGAITRRSAGRIGNGGNDAERAVRAALAIQEAMPRLGVRYGRQLQAHIGIASGFIDSVNKLGAQDEALYTREAIHMATRGNWMDRSFPMARAR